MRGLIPCLCLVALGVTSPAWASDDTDCHQLDDLERAIVACSHIISAERESGNDIANAYLYRGAAYDNKGDYRRAVADYDAALRIDPNDASAYINRGFAYGKIGEYDREIADETKANELDPNNALAYLNRGSAYGNKGDFDREIADETKAIELNREFSPALLMAYNDRGFAYGGKGEYDREIADETKAIELNPNFGYAYYNRANAYTAKSEATQGLADYQAAARLIAESDPFHDQARKRAAELEAVVSIEKRVTQTTTEDHPASQTTGGSFGRRIALVIGNSAYAAVTKLANPEHDADAIAAALKGDGFDVAETLNVTRGEFVATLNRFANTAATADLAVIYFAGHGLQLEGVNYLIPVDAELVADRDVQNEAIALDRVIATVSGARKLGWIIVDACRNNPFRATMHFTFARRGANTRGLARVEARGTTLIQFSASDGEEALDGDPNGNSPFAAALAKRLATPGLEVGKLLRQVNEDVLAATSNQQVPMFSGNLPAEDVFFRP